jgi:uncharacterized damage-inducible protein DinB
MTVRQFVMDEMNREVARSRRALQNVPAGQYEWKPHDKSMPFGHLADMVATIPSWIKAIVTTESLDVAPVDGPSMRPEPKTTSDALLKGLEETAAAAREALELVTDEVLDKTWQLKAAGKVVQEVPRLEAIQDTLNHWAHHRGQLTVYLRLLGAKVPSIYGPSADDPNFR